MITATLRMKTALSVGARAALMPTGSDLPVIKTPEGIPFIPGSSLKGVVRAFDELPKLFRAEHARIHPAPLHAASKVCAMDAIAFSAISFQASWL